MTRTKEMIAMLQCLKILQKLVNIILLTDKGGLNFSEMTTSARKTLMRIFTRVEMDLKHESIERFYQDQTDIFPKKVRFDFV